MIAGLEVNKEDLGLLKFIVEASERSRRMNFGAMKMIRTKDKHMLLFTYDASTFRAVISAIAALFTLSVLGSAIIFGTSLTLLLGPLFFYTFGYLIAAEFTLGLLLALGLKKAGYRSKWKIIDYKHIAHNLLE